MLGGCCSIGKNTFIGLGSRIKDHINIGKNVTIGAGAVVINDIQNGVTAVGVPAGRK